MKALKAIPTSIPINIWDDFYDDGYVPEGKKQESYIYVEDYDIPHKNAQKCLEILLNHIQNNNLLPGVKLWMNFHDSKLLYPHMVGTENEWCLYQRWEIRIEDMTHKQLYGLLEKLETSGLNYHGLPFRIYSES